MHEQRTAADIDLVKLRRIGGYGETCMSEATGQAWGWEPHANLCRRAQRQTHELGHCEQPLQWVPNHTNH